MNIFQIVGVGIIGAILSLTVKKYNPDLSILISIASGLIIIFGILESISQIIDVLKLISEKSGINSAYISLVLKVIAIAYVSEFGAQLCKDAGENAIGAKVELSGKVLIMVISAPVILAVLDMSLNLIG